MVSEAIVFPVPGRSAAQLSRVDAQTEGGTRGFGPSRRPLSVPDCQLADAESHAAVDSRVQSQGSAIL